MSLTTTIYSDQEIVTITPLHLDELKKAAKLDPYGRARICLHLGPEAPIHEMLIAFCSTSYVRPHRNVRSSKSYYVIEGKMLVLIFDDAGQVMRRIELISGQLGKPFLCRLNVNCWHTIISRSDELVFLETNGGPFFKELEEYAAWAPENWDSTGIEAFLLRML